MKMYRQGDVLLVEVNTIPTGLEEVMPENGRIILAYGEVTGHHHSFQHRNKVAFFREDGSGNGYLRVNEPDGLTHQEHNTIPVETGKYRVVLQRNYQPRAATFTARVED